MTQYDDQNLLMLSGIQHYACCPRQWALIHIEQQWQENHLTLEGDYLHSRVDNPLITNRSRGSRWLRSVPLVSRRLGLSGTSDAIELRPAPGPENAIVHPRETGYWYPRPVEYKRGKPKTDNIDRVQLCAQAMALEEMWHIAIDSGKLYYGETRHSLDVTLDTPLRQQVEQLCQSMHQLFEQGITPRVEQQKRCRGCSLSDICLPTLQTDPPNVNQYLIQLLNHA